MFDHVFGPIHQIIRVADVRVSLLGWVLFNLFIWAWGGLTGLLLVFILRESKEWSLSIFLASLTVWAVLSLVGLVVTSSFGLFLATYPLRTSRRFVFWMDRIMDCQVWEMESVVTMGQLFLLPLVVVAGRLLDPVPGSLVATAWALLTMLGWAWFFRRHW